MKRKFITLFVVALVVAGIIVVNRFEPQRLAQAHYDAQQKTAESIEAADAAEAESEGLVGKEYMANLETQVDAQKQIIAANVEEAKDYLVTFDCSNGEIVLEVSAALAPLGAAQFRKAIEDGVYDGAKFFRVIPGFMAQFGISGDPKKAAKWEKLMIKDDPVKASNTRGTMSFATAGPNTRTTQLFINFGDNSNLDDMKFAPFARVIKGMDVVDSIFSGYGAQSNDQDGLKTMGNSYLESKFPKLDFIKKATISVIPVEDGDAEKEDDA